MLALLLLAQGPSSARIVVEPDRVTNHITPAMYGSCIEDVNHEIYGGLYAQRISGESFEEPARGDSGVSGMWDPIGNASFSRDGDAFNGDRCQKIMHGDGFNAAGVANRGLNRLGDVRPRGASDGGTRLSSRRRRCGRRRAPEELMRRSA